MPAPRGDKWETDVERKLVVLGQLVRKVFSGTGMHPNGEGGIDSDNYVAGVSGYRFDDSGNAEFNDITLRGGIIGNDALTDPVQPYVGHAQADSFVVPTTNTAVATLTVPVPSGYTQAMVTAYGQVSAFNPNAGSDYLFAGAWIQTDTTIGWSMPVTIGPSQSMQTSQVATALLTGLGASFTVKVFAGCVNAAFTTDLSGNVANIDATVLFLR